MAFTKVRSAEVSNEHVVPDRMRVVLADDSYLVREGTAALLREIDDLELVAVVDGVQPLRAAVEEHRPDAVITDIRMPPTQTREGIDVARWVAATHPTIAVLLLSQHVEGAYVHELLDAGVTGFGYLLKERVQDVDQLVQALRTICGRGLVLDPSVAEELIAARRRAEASPLDRLTDRELEVLAEIAQGRTNAAIAGTLHLSERSVERHINSVFTKLDLSESDDVHRRVKATLTFLEHRQSA